MSASKKIVYSEPVAYFPKSIRDEFEKAAKEKKKAEAKAKADTAKKKTVKKTKKK